MTFRYGEKMGDEARRAGARTFPQCAIARFGQHHDRVPSSTGYVLRFTAQSSFDDLAELSLGILQTPLCFVHGDTFPVRFDTGQIIWSVGDRVNLP